jgi:hypothetical protein
VAERFLACGVLAMGSPFGGCLGRPRY